VAPPIYGCWHAAQHTVTPDEPIVTPWLSELNLDPRHRVAAAMGTRVVQEQQEQLMASAWEQLGDIEKINQRLRQAQLSRAVNEKYHSRAFKNFSEEVLLRIVAPAQSQLMISQPASAQPTGLLIQMLSRSAVPSTAVSATLRSLSRPRGAINRKFALPGTTGVHEILKIFNKPVAPAGFDLPKPNRGPVTIDQISDAVLVALPLPIKHFEEVPFLLNKRLLETFRFTNLAADFMRTIPLTSRVGQEDFDAAIKLHEYLERVCPPLITSDIASIAMIAPNELKTSILASLNPAATVAEAVTLGATLKTPNPLTGDNLDPIMDAPDFPHPMYEALRDLSQDFFFPGLELVPDDTVELLQTNARFIESFMVGLNAEMGRELLWRNYPTDQRGTYFRQFWDTSTAGKDSQFDISPIHEWQNRQLGATAVGPGGDKLVLLIRGELLRRYPGTVIYAAKAMVLNGKRVPAIDHPLEAAGLPVDPPLESYPMFRGTLEPDVTFVGFNLTEQEVLADDGWFFVLQQQPTEPRFGLDIFRLDNGEPPELSTWNDLNWSHLGSGQQFSHIEVRKFQLQAQDDRGTWARNSAHMAYITKQLPARIAIHATELIHKEP
jgi:hypothetical protein